MNLYELIEREHKKELSELKFLEMLREQARNSHTVLKKVPIFREDKGSDFMLVTPTEKENRSSFWIDKLVKDQVTWKRYPSRSRFIKGFTSTDRLSGLDGDVYVVIPLDHAKIGICPSTSFYRSFKNLEKIGLSSVNNDELAQWIYTIFSAICNIYPEAKLELRTPSSYGEFKKMLTQADSVLKGNQSKLTKLMKSREISDEEKIILEDLLSRHITSCEAYLAEKLDPDQNKFNVVRVEGFSISGDNREVWTSDPCLLIKHEKYIELYKKGSIK